MAEDTQQHHKHTHTSKPKTVLTASNTHTHTHRYTHSDTLNYILNVTGGEKTKKQSSQTCTETSHTFTAQTQIDGKHLKSAN